jgi:hypothetical protein
MANANQYSDADQPRFELFWSLLMMIILLGALGLGTVRFLQLLRGLAVSTPYAPFFDGSF